ncbi:MAG: hypothetical protein AB8F74_05720 [Saprospiraceae bacterium]
MTSSPLLYDILQKLDKSELRQFKKFIRSPFVTHREDVGKLFNVLADYLYRQKTLPTKAVLYNNVFPEDAFDDQKLRSLMSDLHKFVELFLKWVAVQEDATSCQLALAATYRQRNLPKHFQRSISKVETMQEKQPLRNPEYYQNQLRLQVETAEFQTANKRTGNLNLQEIGDTLDTLYLARRLRHACTQLSHRAVFQTDYEFGLLKEWIDYLDESEYLKIPAIALYYYCYRFLTEEYSQSYFRKFRTALSTHQSHFPKEELKGLYRAAINFCIRKLNEGSLDYSREGWELFQEGLVAGYFVENNRLSRFTFDNIVGIGLRLKEHEEVEIFIKKYNPKLASNYRDSTVNFNLARLEYDRKNYDKALQYLQISDAKDLVNQLISKTLLLKIYYETEEFDLLDSHLDSFRQFIRRREVSDYHQQNFRNVIHFTRKLIALAPYDQEERERLGVAIRGEKVLTERGWLLEKLERS